MSLLFERIQRAHHEYEAIGEIVEQMAREKLERDGYGSLGRGWKKEHTGFSDWELLEYPASSQEPVVLVHFYDRRDSDESHVRLTKDCFQKESTPSDPYDDYKDLRWNRPDNA